MKKYKKISKPHGIVSYYGIIGYEIQSNFGIQQIQFEVEKTIKEDEKIAIVTSPLIFFNSDGSCKGDSEIEKVLSNNETNLDIIKDIKNTGKPIRK